MTGFRAAFILLFTLLTAVRCWYRLKAGTFRERIVSDREPLPLVLFRWALGLPLLFAVFVFIFHPVLIPWAFLPLADGVRWCGAALGAIALSLIVSTHKALGRQFSPTLRLRPDHRLVTTGPYRLIRHPMYAGYLLLFLGAFLLSAGWLIGLAGAAIILSLMTARLPREEALLSQRFGREYQDYRAETGRFFPRLMRKATRRLGREEA
jgi:protein-S-isoprenylcysteine O-methyltransferase Ste14